jgi:hypothetical protein
MKKREFANKEQEEKMKTQERINSVRDRRTFFHNLHESKGEFKPRVTIYSKNNGDIDTSKDEW